MVHSRVIVGYEVLIAVNMKSTLFWVVMLCTSQREANILEEHITSIFRVVK
jgi:hypothetical protein